MGNESNPTIATGIPIKKNRLCLKSDKLVIRSMIGISFPINSGE